MWQIRQTKIHVKIGGSFHINQSDPHFFFPAVNSTYVLQYREKRGSCFLNKILCAFIFLRKISLYFFIPLGIISINYARDTCLYHLPLIMNIIPSWKKWPPRLFLSVKTKPNIRIYLNLNFVLNNSTNLILLSNYSNINLVKGEKERKKEMADRENFVFSK